MNAKSDDPVLVLRWNDGWILNNPGIACGLENKNIIFDLMICRIDRLPAKTDKFFVSSWRNG